MITSKVKLKFPDYKGLNSQVIAKRKFHSLPANMCSTRIVRTGINSLQKVYSGHNSQNDILTLSREGDLPTWSLVEHKFNQVDLSPISSWPSKAQQDEADLRLD